MLRHPESKYRLWTVMGSLALGITGVLLCLSITADFFELGSFISGPGSFFSRSYGLLAFIIPAFLLYAAFLLADPHYRPERIFFLCSSIVPFFTLSLGFYWIREFERLRLESSFLTRAEKTGIGFFIFFLIALEILIIILLHYLLYKWKDGSGFMHKTDEAGQKTSTPSGEEAGKVTAGMYPAVPGAAKNNLRDIYAQSAAAMSAEEDHFRIAAKGTSGESGMDEGVYIPELLPAAAEPQDQSDTYPSEKHPPEIFPPEKLPDSSQDIDDDVEKALAEASAFAAAISGEEAARHGDRKGAAYYSPERKAARDKKRRLPYFVPVEGILKQYPDGEYWVIDDETRNAAHTLKETFREFNIQVEVTGIRKGPVITMFEILPAPGIRLAKIENLADNIALRLAAQSVRIVAPIPGKHAVGVEVPNAKRNIVSFREIIEGELSRDGKKAEIPLVLGKDITGEAVTVDLVQMPHLLIAGATGSGKSVCVNSMILTMLYRKPPAECRLILIDPKIVELKLYNDIPHLLTPVITEPKKAFQALQYCICEMERRYACLDSMGVRDIRSYNKRIVERNMAAEYMPYIVVVIDEFADLMATTGKELESTVARLAAMSRAIGIHLVLATQRPSIDVITGLIKANIPSRIAFMVAGRMNSQIIIDTPGAEKLLGKGDMLYAGVIDPFPVRMQGAFVSEEEVERVVDYVKSLGEPDYIDDEIFYDEEEEENDPSLFYDGEDPLYEKALEIVMNQGKASASYIQRRLKVGYNRAARLVEVMEQQGVVGPAQGSKPREILRGI